MRYKHAGENKRRYIRLDSVFPVEFTILNAEGRICLSGAQQGFTNNVGKGGMCLTANNCDPEFIRYLNDPQIKFSLGIEMPLGSKAITATAHVAWVKAAAGPTNKYLIGLSYDRIDKQQNARIMRYAWAKKLFFPIALSLIFILALGFTVNSLISAKVINGNKVLVEQLVKIIQDSSIAKQKVKRLYKDRQELEVKIQEMQSRIQTLEEERIAQDQSKNGKLSELGSLISQLIREKESLREKLIGVQQKENIVTEELLRLDKKMATLEKANMDKMYEWLKTHQNPRTGLVVSFEGDRNVEGWAFTYDQALAIQAYTNFADFSRAKKLLDFFKKKAERREGEFLNAYHVNDGRPAEHTVHSGPNIWLGIAAVQYTNKTRDTAYLGLAEEIAGLIIRMQTGDSDGGIKGGPGTEWYSTEHNLDAYAFFNMLHKVTGKEKYLKARDKTLDWLKNHTYDKTDIPVRRGKGDSTIATDTYAWSVAAIGPQRLEEMGMNPDRIMEFAEANCSVSISYERPQGGVVQIKGFDFAPYRHVARGGVISSEWTAQMVLSFRIMADFYYKKNMAARARSYDLKADEYLAELGNMVISSPSPSGQGASCLPYATQDNVDTGHGWFTPKGARTGSVAGTVYTLFAYYRYNPLELAQWPAS